MSLLTAYQNITRVAGEKRKLMKLELLEKLRRFREEVNNNRENGRDPLSIFPEEIWLMILSNLTAVNDRSSVSQTCQLFGRLVEETKVELLFGQVFPILFADLENNRSARGSLECRRVCKSWRSGVDSYLENYHFVDTPPRDMVDLIRKGGENLAGKVDEYKFVDGNPFYVRKGGDTIKGSMWHHEFLQRNPIYTKEKEDPSLNPVLGGAVALELGRYSGKFPKHWKRLLKKEGGRILNLSLVGQAFNLVVHKSFSLISNAVCQSLRHCTNLTSLTLDRWGCAKWSPVETFAIPDNILPQIESLIVGGWDRQFLIIQDALVWKYSGQLKSLNVSFWNADLYQTLHWSSLEELEICSEKCVELLETLKLVSAPKLRKLGIRLDRSGPKLEAIISLVTHFPKLDHLCLRITHNFPGFSTQEIASLSPDVICSVSISTLELTARTKEFCYDFVICFPFVRTLVIVKGSGAASRYNLYDRLPEEENPPIPEDNGDDDDAEWVQGSCGGSEDSFVDSERYVDNDSDGDDAIPDPATQSKSWNGTTHHISRDSSLDFVQLSCYVPTGFIYRERSLERFHQSNIWTLCPFLGQVKFHHVTKYTCEENLLVYKRELFEWRGMDKTKRIEARILLNERRRQFQKAWRKNKEKSLTFVKEANHPDQNLAKIYPESLFEKVFPLMRGWIGKQDVLNCRLVCKNWSLTVDHHLNNYFCFNDRTKRDNHLFEYKFHVGDAPELEFPRSVGHDHVREYMKLHNRNPFVGRSVTIFLNGSNILSELNKFYDIFGLHIWHVRLCGKDPQTFRLSPDEYKNLYIDTLQKCANLRSLCVSGIHCQWRGSNDKICAALNTIWSVKLDVPFLQSLTIHDDNPGVKPLLKKLLTFYGDQLKHLYLHCYAGRDEFQCLEKYTVLAPFKDTFDCPFRYLDKSTGNLKSLEIRLAERTKPSLKLLMEEIYSFSTLKELKLLFSEEYAEFSWDEVKELMIFYPKLISPPGITKLEIIVKDKNMSYDFLCLFPYLKELVVRHGRWASHWYNLQRQETQVEKTDSDREFEEEDSSFDEGSSEEEAEAMGEEEEADAMGEEEEEAMGVEEEEAIGEEEVMGEEEEAMGEEEEEAMGEEEEEAMGEEEEEAMGEEEKEAMEPKSSAAAPEKAFSVENSYIDQNEVKIVDNPGHINNNEEKRQKANILKLNLEPDYIQIANHIQGDDDNDDGNNDVSICQDIYTSKFWQVLPSLEQLKLIHVVGNEEQEENKILLYTRGGLEKFFQAETKNYK